MIKNIIFDFGCVLVELDKQRCVEAFRSIGAESISAYVDECRQEDLFHDLETGKTDIAAFCDEVRRQAPACKADNDSICRAWNSLLGGIPRRRLEKLASLKGKYRLFVLSNTNPIHWRKAVDDYFTTDGMTVDDYFERVFLSYRMHLVKPDSEIFSQTLREAGIKAGETLFIDDSEANCRSAAATGINVMHVDNGDEWLDKI